MSILHQANQNENMRLSKRGLTLYFALFDRFVAAGGPVTFHLSPAELSELTGLEVWEVLAARIELLVVGCLRPINFSPSRTHNVYSFVSPGRDVFKGATLVGDFNCVPDVRANTRLTSGDPV